MGPRGGQENGWGRRIRTPATWSRATRPTTRRSPSAEVITPQGVTTVNQTHPSRPDPGLRGDAEGIYLTADLRDLLGLKRGTRAGGIRIVLPVRGLVVIRAPRRATWKVPKPEIVTRCPFRSESRMAARKASMSLSAEALVFPVDFAIATTNSAFVMTSPPSRPHAVEATTLRITEAGRGCQ